MLKTFDEICTFPVVYDAYLAARRGKRSKAATAKYEAHALENVSNLVYILRTQLYRPGPFHLFTVYEPKERLVQAPAFTDKVVQHALVDNVVYERLTRSFILDNYASQIGKGLHFGLDRLSGFMTDYWNKHHTAEGWVLKCDVRKFFASIDHDILKTKLLALDFEPEIYTMSINLELNEKTHIFPLRNGIDFLGFHTYLTDSGKVIRKLRHNSVKKMRAKLRYWAKAYPKGEVDRDAILASWQAWDAHAAHGNTWRLRQEIRQQVKEILKEDI